MAKFQTTTPREDAVPRRPITLDDIRFLTELQRTLNTQDTMGNADPRFWVVAQSRIVPVPLEDAQKKVVVDANGESYGSLKELAEYVRRETGSREAANAIEACWDMDEAVQTIQDDPQFEYLDGKPFHLAGLKRDSEIVKDTLFLTHAACEEHLRAYGHNYEEDAHAFAMTAVRSPEFERLLRLLQTMDWESLSVHLYGKGV